MRSFLGGLFASGAIVDLILAFMALELIVLIIVRKKSVPALHIADVLASLAAGAALLLVLRSVMRGKPWEISAFWLVVALLCHLWDLRRRWTARRTF